MEYKNYSISAGKGKLYLKEKNPTDGYIEVPYGTEGAKTYHLYKDSVKGLPKYFETKEITYEGKVLKFLELTLVDGEASNKISVPLKSLSGNYSDETKGIISALNGLELGEEITLTPKSTSYTSKTNGKEYKNINIYVNYVNRLNDNGKGLSTGFIPYADIPRAIEKVVAGDKVYDWSPQTEFYYAKLNEIVERFKGAPTTETNKTLPTTTAEQAFDNVAPQIKTEDLPF
jgi:hypothetical protein